MNTKDVSAGLRKVAEELRKRAERESAGKTVALDPRRVLDFMLFYGR